MAKFNVMQRRRRAQIAERKRAIHGDPTTGKLKNRPQPLSISGKRKRKLLKKWRRVHLSLSLSLSLSLCVILCLDFAFFELVPWCCEWLLHSFSFIEKNQEQKDAIEKGLVSMEDVEMAASQGTS